MKTRCSPIHAFAGSELMVVLAIVAILAGLMLPALGVARRSAQRTKCANNLHQLAWIIRMYADDMGDVGPAKLTEHKSLDGWMAYKQLLNAYRGQAGGGTFFACPSDKYHYGFTAASSNAYQYIGQAIHLQSWSDYSSYAFNGGNTRTNTESGIPYPGIAGKKLTAIHNPSATILVAEVPAYYCYSWHDPQNARTAHYFNRALNEAAFVDGSVRYLPFFYDSQRRPAEAWQYDPPAEFEYKWSAE
ncbi:MAG TPA: type II secretion system protein [Candidatus Limnocylindria bacterium]|jgi:type II secretory pathway pseudopilin PulG|nr:type II secretion system protein [Candidatus Limnocylindria bacterium]